MYLYSALYYFITALSSTASDVVLAANIEDFRSIAKEFVPDDLANAIFKMAKDAIGNDASRQLNEFPKIRDISPDTDIATESYNTENTVRPEYKKRKESDSSPTKKTTSKYELSLDDIVEKIKKRLQSELTLMAATADTRTTTEKSYEIPKVLIDNPIKPQSGVLEDGQQSRYINPPSRYVKQTRNIIENKSREEEGREKKSKQRPTNDSYVTQQSKYMLSQGKLEKAMKQKYAIRPGNHKAFTAQHNVNNKKHMKRDRNINLPKRITSTTTGIFSAVNLASKDSYEDYVTPKKDEDYIEQETEAKEPKKVDTNNSSSKKEPVDQMDKKILNIFSDETETKAKEYINYEDETTNYNKRKIKKPSSNLGQKHNNRDSKYFVENLPYKVAGNIEQDIQPYRGENDRDNLQEKDYAGDNEQPAAETSKAKSEGFFFNIGSNRQYITPDAGKHKNRNRFKTNGRQSQDTDIPKRNTNRLESPNNLVKIPKADEKYDLDEPNQNEDQYTIPETT
ncbi:unnamed protein product [Arctia plantaginis]|uniref:Uncharacterized protein n=1 Tax=Arctia plantaginis TaxID=874455 RepID=A0A8S1A862_ARCPL|nr:unnamed protein product [Arctia plantaginis]